MKADNHKIQTCCKATLAYVLKFSYIQLTMFKCRWNVNICILKIFLFHNIKTFISNLNFMRMMVKYVYSVIKTILTLVIYSVLSSYNNFCEKESFNYLWMFSSVTILSGGFSWSSFLQPGWSEPQTCEFSPSFISFA